MKILVPLDGSKLSETIMGRVAQLAEATDSEVILLSVVEEPRIGGTWLEALATVDETTGEFGMAGTSYLRRAQQQSDAVAETRDQAMERAMSYFGAVPGPGRRGVPFAQDNRKGSPRGRPRDGDNGRIPG